MTPVFVNCAQGNGKGCVRDEQRLPLVRCTNVSVMTQEQAMSTTPGRDTVLCISLAGRPGTFGVRFHNHLYQQLGLDFY